MNALCNSGTKTAVVNDYVEVPPTSDIGCVLVPATDDTPSVLSAVGLRKFLEHLTLLEVPLVF